MPRAIYPGDITREQFEVIRPQLDNFKKTTKPRVPDVYDVFCAIVYVLKSCSQWSMLPSDYPKWGTVYSYFRQWNHQPEPASGETEGPLSLLEKQKSHNAWNLHDT
jgi:transposase